MLQYFHSWQYACCLCIIWQYMWGLCSFWQIWGFMLDSVLLDWKLRRHALVE